MIQSKKKFQNYALALYKKAKKKTNTHARKRTGAEARGSTKGGQSDKKSRGKPRTKRQRRGTDKAGENHTPAGGETGYAVRLTPAR
ncbi:hypothetical protein, partial [Lactococcus cremoris]|uniref:hypothetical protein n=1 Tax=Lactococcus lactis subsp. cremoris TaxID=1359 RepID=UPI0005C1FE0C